MKNLQLSWGLMVALALVVVAPATLSSAPPPTLAQPGCKSTCGKITIPYPFGIGNPSEPKSCFSEKKYRLTCKNDDSTLYYGDTNVSISNINLQSHQMDLLFYVASLCHNESGGRLPDKHSTLILSADFTISSKENKLLTVGTDSYGFVKSFFDGESYSTGCLTSSEGYKKIQNGTCSGIGCCQVDITPGMRNISLWVKDLDNPGKRLGNCSYSFVVKNGIYSFSTTDLHSFPNNTLPLVLDWTVGNNSCNDAQSSADYACKENSKCDDKDSDHGYRCICNDGYEGNPYLGCSDIDECMKQNHTCVSDKNCKNNNGSYTCSCRKWQSGNGRKEGGCNVHPMVIVGAVAGFVILFLGSVIPYVIYQKTELNKLKKENFQQNGGPLLQDLQKEKHFKSTKIFTEEELRNATLDFNHTNKIDGEGSAEVYRGYLDNATVAIKKSKIVDNDNRRQQFIKEVVVLSLINHKNVVKYLGCCLETKVPFLVYEFVNNGTLFNFIHTQKDVNATTWTTRVKIAADVARALVYLHSEALDDEPIVHRNVKTSNILLDSNYTARLFNLGASTFTTPDQNELSPIVQETADYYLDPECKEPHQFTEKNDVYSFGIVLVELLTGQQKKEHADHILSSSKENLLEVVQEGLLNEKNKEQIEKVAILAAKCLNRIGKERPSMKVVVTELDKITSISTDPNLMEPKPNYERGDSSSHKKGNDSIEGQVPATLNYGR